MDDLIKFPRTEHIFDAGGSAIARDDLLIDPKDAHARFLSGQALTVEEKVDGANLGISLAPDYSVRFQNSHYVNSSTHPQFKGLDSWLERHRADVYQVLGDEPGKYILFGEWMFAKHSLEYVRLPDYFIAFDIYDCASRQFLSRALRDGLLADTSISTVPLIAEGRFTSKQQLLQLLDMPSQFYDGPVEGIYLRVHDAEGVYLADRSKLVRADFIQGITEHWMSRELVRNKLAYG